MVECPKESEELQSDLEEMEEESDSDDCSVDSDAEKEGDKVDNMIASDVGKDSGCGESDSGVKESAACVSDFKSRNENLLAQFWNLASLDETLRATSVVNLLKELRTSGKQADLEYTAQRLVKGLSSSRKAARQGFATALTHVMINFKEVDALKILELMSKHLAVQGSFKGQEERDAYFGQIFGILAICRSQLQNNSPAMDGKLAKILIEKVLALTKKKSYLREVCGKVLCDILKCLKYEIYQEIRPMMESRLNAGWEKCSPEDLMVVLTVHEKFKDEIPKKAFKEHWNRSEILHKSNYSHLSRVLMDTTNTAHPHIHMIWDIILADILSPKKLEDGSFESFWKTVVEDGLMQSTHERKFLVMNLILKLAPNIPANKVDVIFGATITRCIINSCQSKSNYLYNIVRNMLSKLPKVFAGNTDKDIIQRVIKCLVGRNGHVSFDSITKTKIVEELTLKVSHNLVDYFTWLKEVFTAGSSQPDLENQRLSIKDANECRAWVANQLITLLRISKTQNDESLISDITNFIFLHAYFDVIKKSKKEALLHDVPLHPVSESTHKYFQPRFNTALKEIGNIFNNNSGDDNKQIIGGIAEDGEFYAWKVLCFGKKLLEKAKYVQLSSAWTPEIFESFNSSLERISAMISKVTLDNMGVNSKGAQLLFIHATLQLFTNGEEAVDTLKDLDTCFEKAEAKKRKKKTEHHWTEILTEILLGFMAQSSHLMRHVVDLVFPTIVPHLTHEAFTLLINAIQPKKSNEEECVDFEDMSDIEEIAEKELDENDSDEKENKTDKNQESPNEAEEQNSNNSENDSSDSSDDDSDDDNSDMEIDEAFKAELKAALGDSAVNSEDENSDGSNEEDDGDDDDNIDMDTCDPMMLQGMDEALAAVFRSRKKKEEKKDRKLSILHFKLRVLDLIEIFIKKQSKDLKILLLLEPLLDIINASHGHSEEQPMFERSLGIFKNKLCNLHEYPCGSDLDIDDVHTQIENFVETAKTASSALLITYITQGIIYLIRVLRGNLESKGSSPVRTRSARKHKKEEVKPQISQVGCLNEQRLLKCFKEALTEFMTKRSSHLQPVLFVELIQRFPSLGWKLAIDIPQYLNDGCNNFRKVKACEMLKLLFSKKTDNFEESMDEIAGPFNENIIKAFQATKEKKYSLKARQFHDIVKLALLFIKEVAKYPKISSKADIDGMKLSITETLESDVVTRSPSLHSYCQKFLTSLNNVDTLHSQKKKQKR